MVMVSGCLVCLVICVQVIDFSNECLEEKVPG
jgi:hypothetical protein